MHAAPRSRFAADIAALKGDLSWPEVRSRIARATGSAPPSVGALSAAADPAAALPAWSTVRLLVTGLLHERVSREELAGVLEEWRLRLEELREPVADASGPVTIDLDARPEEFFERPKRRRLLPALITVAVAAAAVGGYAVWRDQREAPAAEPPQAQSSAPGSAPPSASPSPAPAGKEEYSVRRLVGPGCPDDFTGHFPQPVDGHGWTAAAGGWDENRCDGSALWTPSPGGTGPVVDSYVWHWTPDESDLTGPLTCRLEVYVPATEQPLGRAVYVVSTKDGAGEFGENLDGSAPIEIEQAAQAGEWADLGEFTSADATFGVTVFVGAEEPGGAGIAVSAARLSC